MSVDSAENNVSNWGQTNASTNYDNGTNQWLVNTSTNDKTCSSWAQVAQAVSGDLANQQSTSNNTNSIIPNNLTTKQQQQISTSNQNQELIDETGSQQVTHHQNLLQSQFNFDHLNPNDELLYNSKWGKSVINHDNAWDHLENDLSPSSANIDQSTITSSITNQSNSSQSGFKTSTIEQQIRNNNGTELWENNLRQTKEIQSGIGNSCLIGINNSGISNSMDCLQSTGNLMNNQSNQQQSIDQQTNCMIGSGNSNGNENQWISKLVPQTANQTAQSNLNLHRFGGIWGEDEDLSNVWIGIPNNSSQNSLQNHQSNQNQLSNLNNTSSTTTSSNVFNNRQPNSINCDKGQTSSSSNLQLLSNSNKNWISDDNNWGDFFFHF